MAYESFKCHGDSVLVVPVCLLSGQSKVILPVQSVCQLWVAAKLIHMHFMAECIQQRYSEIIHKILLKLD